MKNFTLKATVGAVAALVGAGVFAGTITSPPTGGGIRYAIEAMTNTTPVTSPAIVYTMGVSRTAAQDFTIIMTPGAGQTFTGGTCLAMLPVVGGGGGGAGTASVKRASTVECAYEVDVTTTTTTAATLTFTAPVFATHSMATAGNTLDITLNLWDLGETARIDNNAAVSRTVGTSVQALTLTAAADAFTRADVLATPGPLFLFLTDGVNAPTDSTTVARANLVVVNNNAVAPFFVLPDGATSWDFALHGTNIAVTIAGTNFTGLAATPVAVAPPGGPAIVTTTTGTQSSFVLLPAHFTGPLGNATFTVGMTAAGTSSLGVSRFFGASALGKYTTGADQALPGNASWWTWGANATQLIAPYFSHDSSHVTRYVLLNTSAAAVAYSTTCYSETGNAKTAGAGATGSLAAGSTTVIMANTVCTLAGAPRGSVVFTINAPAGSIKGTYNQYNVTSGATSFGPMERPHDNLNPTL